MMDASEINLSMIHVGDRTPEIHFEITHGQIKEYAEISTDNNPLHVDEEFAKNTPFKGIIAHGTIPLAYLFQSVYEYFRLSWINGIKFNVKFVAPVRPKDVVSCNGIIKNVNVIENNIVVELQCINQNNEKVIIGEAIVPIQ